MTTTTAAAGVPSTLGRDVLKLVLATIAKLLLAMLIVYALTDEDPRRHFNIETAQEYKAIKEVLGYEGPFMQRFAIYATRAFSGDFGQYLPSNAAIAEDSAVIWQVTLSRLAIVIALLTIFMAGIIRLSRVSPLGRTVDWGIAIFGGFPVIVLSFMMSAWLIAWPIGIESNGTYPNQPAFWIAAALLSLNLLFLIAPAKYAGGAVGTDARPIINSTVVTLRYAPAWLLSAVFLMEYFSSYDSFVLIAYSSMMEQRTWLELRALATWSVWIVVAAQFLGGLLQLFAGRGQPDAEAEIEKPDTMMTNPIQVSKTAIAGGVIVLLFIILGLGADVFATHDPIKPDYNNLLKAPGGDFLLGTDRFGRDIWSRFLYGARSILAQSGLALFIALAAAAILRLISSRLTSAIGILPDAAAAVPPFILAMLCFWAFRQADNSAGAAQYVLILAAIPYAYYGMPDLLVQRRAVISTARHLSGLFLSPRPMAGAPLAAFCRLAALLIGLHYTINYLNLGVAPPLPSWGGMGASGRDYFLEPGKTYPVIISLTGAVLLTSAFLLLAAGFDRMAQRKTEG